MNKRFTFFTPLLLASLVTLAGCGKETTEGTASPSTAPSIAASPSAVVPSNAPQTPVAQSPSAAAGDAVAYQDPNGLYAISFPAGYTYEDTGSGIAFASGDQGFAGSVDFGSAQGQQLSNDDLEAALKSEYEKRLKEVTWQKSEIQPDGSIRVDWVGTDPSGNKLDAISFVEQRGDNIFILNLFGVNHAYQDYNSDAEVIVGGYRIRQ